MPSVSSGPGHPPPPAVSRHPVALTRRRAVVVDAIARLLVSRPPDRPTRVAVDGITAVGKTTFADDLAGAVEAHGRPVRRVTMDGFHHPRTVRYRQGADSADGYYDDAYDFGALRRELLDPLGPGGDRRYRTAVIDLARDRPVTAAPRSAGADLVVVVDGSFLQRAELRGGWDAVIFLRADFEVVRTRGVARDASLLGGVEEADRRFRVRYHAAQRRYLEEVRPESTADVVVDHDDPLAPTLREIRAVASPARIADARSFFGPRADGWNQRFAADGPGFRRAVADARIDAGATVLDLGCGAGRALPELQAAAGEAGTVIGLDLTPEMLAAARREHPGTGLFVLADGTTLPLPRESVDVLFAAGFVGHVDDPARALVELARVARAGATLVLFHPVARSALAAKHGHGLRPDDPLDPANLRILLEATGWSAARIDDGGARFLAVAHRTARPS